ncbi:DUF4159 domain-containing protein [bacterium AH-315-I18]|nr:DUF4159 domain-containing protein [Phycisphaeraceae bacterium]MBN4061020.1 DUF4159 domain-containing protein [bacterium AH-315-I18]
MHRPFFLILCLACMFFGQFIFIIEAQAQSVKQIEVALLTYNRGKTAACFATKFLDLAARKAKIDVSRSLHKIPLEKSDLTNYPLVIFAGDLRFKLSDKEMVNLKNYMQKGGFVIATAGCSNEIWNASFKKMMKKMLPNAKFEPLAMGHPVFHTLYDLKQLNSTKGKKTPILYGLKLNGRLAVIYSPVGVNDTAHAGGDCCCCGGEEILQSHLVNANILAYVLTH